jgi:hypothetical protein
MLYLILVALYHTIVVPLVAAQDSKSSVGGRGKLADLQIKHISFPVALLRQSSQFTVNDEIVGAVCTAFRSWLTHVGDLGFQSSNFSFHALMPVNMRTLGSKKEGNKISLLTVPLPLNEESPENRLEKIHETMAAFKESGEPWIALYFNRFVSWVLSSSYLLQKAKELFQHNSLGVTNVVGPQGTICIGNNVPIKSVWFTMLPHGSRFHVGLISYAKEMHVTICSTSEYSGAAEYVASHIEKNVNKKV